jgi:acyl-CoA thioester hydrolase
VNNSVYFTYMEMARADYMSRVILQSSITDLGSVGVILAEAKCQYKHPIYFGQSVVIGTRVAEIGNSSWRVEHQIEADGQLAALGWGILVHFDYETQKSQRIPDAYRQRINAFEAGNILSQSQDFHG